MRTEADSPTKPKGNTQVLSTGPIPEITVGPPITAQLLAGNVPGTEGVQPGTVDRATQIQHVGTLASVVADATRRNKPRDPDDENAKGVEIVYACVTNDKAVTVHDKASGGRVVLKPGKQVDSQHYDLVDLAKQGVRFRKVEKQADPNHIPDWIFGAEKN